MVYATASALTTDIFLHMRDIVPQSTGTVFGCRDFVMKQFDVKPALLNLPFFILTLLLNLLSLIRTGTLFFRLLPDDRVKIERQWRRLPGPCADFILFFETLTAFYIFSEFSFEEMR
jgi:hypothetical protein